MTRTLRIGGYYLVNGKRVRFIQVGRKTCNFLDEETGRCILLKTVTAQGYGTDYIPKYDVEVQVKFREKFDLEEL